MSTFRTQVAAAAAALALMSACAATDSSRSTGEFVDDTGIAAKTKTELLADPVTDGLNIDVEVNQQRVQLNGFVDSEEQRKRAGEIAANIDGVKSVENNLRITAGDRQAGQYVDDKVLAARVKTALAESEYADAWEIDVEINRGVVSLGGFVDNKEQHDAALEVARNVDGVVRVIDNLRVAAS